jgi:hypothetical protein
MLIAMVIGSAVACQSLAPPVAAPTPSSSPRPTAASELLHFENEWISFDYPAGLTLYEAGFADVIWYPYIEFGGELVAALGDERFFGFDNYFRSIRIVRRAWSQAADLETIMAEVYAQTGVEHPWPLVDGVLDLSGSISIDARDAIQKSYRIYSGEPAYDLRDIWIPVEDAIFIISIATEWTNPDEFAAFETLADKLLRSLEFRVE